ncbi:hypothetical protein M422DRAFT_29775 [Sphaerobolus stellatus SS14]|uniref:Pal1-domain-containing protein n=1 Tax=Sphaerobolus stellatus (strain SS14) TaxID=990650 RepID=A0A0C9VT14_SPHS4|nr:hypothetical protein M422DRAFT_29775 [Sphaerobolus stellatus SS14]
MLSAVRESVTVKPERTRVSRTQTAHAPGNVTPPRTRRSYSTESPPAPPPASDKPRRPKPTKKASMHADIIDRLDFSGVGAAMLHHDGPFDACAPSRNKNKQRAPMLAWSPTDGPNESLAHSSVDQGSPYYAAGLYQGAGGSTSIPKKRVDALAEAWGIAEPEPYEEFAAGGGIAHKADTQPDSWSRRRDAEPSRSRHNARSRPTLPPPQPIDLPGSRALDPPSPTYGDGPYQPNPNGANAPVTRNKSLMARIRKMREAPNVPVTNDDDSYSEEGASGPAENSARPTHKHQNSFLGRFRAPGVGGKPTSPTGEDFVYVDDKEPAGREKELPPAPDDYFPPTPDRGVGRKTSLMKKIKGGVRGRRNSGS